MFNFYSNTAILGYTSIATLINIIVLIKLSYLLQTTNNFKYLYIFGLVVVLLLFTVFNKLQFYLLIFVILTELTSLYLILVITLNINYFKNTNKNNYQLFPVLLLFTYTNITHCYAYFDFYNINYASLFHQYVFILNSYNILLALNLIILLTVCVTLILSPIIKSNTQSLLTLQTSVISLINQIPLNLNLFTDSTILKWN